ncbi:MAG: class I SAM-dependent methyltransferase [Phycisphaerales bacterium]
MSEHAVQTEPSTDARTDLATDPGVFEAAATVESWDDDYYHPVAVRYYDRAVARMLELMRVPPGGTVLDGGCGPGVHSIRAAKLGYRVDAIDLSHTMLGEAERRVAAAGLADKVTFRQADLTRLELPDASYEHAFSWGVVIHVPDAEAALANLARIIKPGGRLALYLTNKTAIDHELETIARTLVRKPMAQEQHPLGEGVWYEMHDERLWVWRFDLPAVARFMAERGLTLRHRVLGEFSEVQRRVKGLPRRALLHANNAAYAMRLPARWGVTNLLVFERTG